MQIKPAIIIGSAALLASGCGPNQIGFVSSKPVAGGCAFNGQRVSLDQSGITVKRLNPGESTTLRPMLYEGPAIYPGENDCVRNLVVTAKDGATDADYTLTEKDDGSVTFTVSPDVAPGATFGFAARYGKGDEIRDYLVVYDAEKWPLEGVWSQPRKLCGSSAIGELEMRRGSFSVTWQPFESYKDYWGSYVFERDENSEHTGKITLTTTGGNHLPFGKTEHTLRVKIDGDTFTTVEGNFGQSRGGSGVCLEPFTRRR